MEPGLDQALANHSTSTRVAADSLRKDGNQLWTALTKALEILCVLATSKQSLDIIRSFLDKVTGDEYWATLPVEFKTLISPYFERNRDVTSNTITSWKKVPASFFVGLRPGNPASQLYLALQELSRPDLRPVDEARRRVFLVLFSALKHEFQKRYGREKRQDPLTIYLSEDGGFANKVAITENTVRWAYIGKKYAELCTSSGGSGGLLVPIRISRSRIEGKTSINEQTKQDFAKQIGDATRRWQADEPRIEWQRQCHEAADGVINHYASQYMNWIQYLRWVPSGWGVPEDSENRIESTTEQMAQTSHLPTLAPSSTYTERLVDQVLRVTKKPARIQKAFIKPQGRRDERPTAARREIAQPDDTEIREEPGLGWLRRPVSGPESYDPEGGQGNPVVPTEGLFGRLVAAPLKSSNEIFNADVGGHLNTTTNRSKHNTQPVHDSCIQRAGAEHDVANTPTQGIEMLWQAANLPQHTQAYLTSPHSLGDMGAVGRIFGMFDPTLNVMTDLWDNSTMHQPSLQGTMHPSQL